MKILFLASAFNGMVQRAWIELDRLNHHVRIQIATDDDVVIQAVEDFAPELIIAPFLKTKIPAAIWQHHVCLIIHPGIPGDRGASSLDWAILNGVPEWGVTILQAVEKMDAGPIWAFEKLRMRPVSKACLYRHEVTQAAMKALLAAIDRFTQHAGPLPEKILTLGSWNRSTKQSDFAFSWTEDTSSILQKLNAADSDPGVMIHIKQREFYAYGGQIELKLKGQPGELLGQCDKAICIATADNAIWISQLKEIHPDAIKLPAVTALRDDAITIPVLNQQQTSHNEIRYEEENGVGYITFDFYNGAMDTDQCKRLKGCIQYAKKRPLKIIVLLGGKDFWSNGIHLHVIEHAEYPDQEAWENIIAMNDLIEEIILSTDHYIITALQGNAGGGGVPFALTGDKVIAREGIVLNPHTRNIGLYGSEYWTYLLPRRIGTAKANEFTSQCLPWGTTVAKEIGLVDEVIDEMGAEFVASVKALAQEIITLPYFDKLIQAKQLQRRKDERIKPLSHYRLEELQKMKLNFFENDEGFDEKRFRFVHKIQDEDKNADVENKDWYSSRRKIYRRRKWESIEYNPSITTAEIP